METQYIKVADILVDDSQFSLKSYLFEAYNAPTCHITSFDTLGILYPVVLFLDDRHRYHLVDGRKRVQFAKEMREPMIKANVLPGNTPVTDIITLIFCNKRTDIESSAVNKVQFLCYAMALNASDSWIMKTLSVPFEFKPHGSFLRECERINTLPAELKAFCHEKRFSLKQLLNLTYYPDDILNQLMAWSSVLQFTASTFDETASNLRNYLKREGRSIGDFMAEPDVQDLLESSLSPRDKTEKLRRIVHLRQFPLLSSKNETIGKTVNDLRLPKEVRLDWDRTLENKFLSVSVNIHDPSKWQDVLKTLSSEEVKRAVEDILEEL